MKAAQTLSRYCISLALGDLTYSLSLSLSLPHPHPQPHPHHHHRHQGSAQDKMVKRGHDMRLNDATAAVRTSALLLILQSFMKLPFSIKRRASLLPHSTILMIEK